MSHFCFVQQGAKTQRLWCCLQSIASPYMHSSSPKRYNKNSPDPQEFALPLLALPLLLQQLLLPLPPPEVPALAKSRLQLLLIPGQIQACQSHLQPHPSLRLLHQAPSCCCRVLWLSGHALMGSLWQRARCVGCQVLQLIPLLLPRRLRSAVVCAAQQQPLEQTPTSSNDRGTGHSVRAQQVGSTSLELVHNRHH